ncbi:MAG: hypothetical protein CMO34_02850 [Verrucomicrobia bacterium]|nr:hypothetical protein [Verrucomicrobiota bacterium]|tara:strand:+ start:811 stop:1422 length:612 start_codon:yes stop_codon:yes gene_type:complete
MKTKEKEVLLKATELFARFGIKSMTMDDVAHQLGISKKTLYQYVSNKKELVKKCIQEHIDSEECMAKEFLGQSENAIDELMAMTKLVSTQMKEMHPSVIFDLKKYHFEAFQQLTQHRDEFIYNHIKCNLKEGVKSGLYRNNINPDILARLYISMVNVIMDPVQTDLSSFNNADIYNEMIRYHVRGIASAEGRKYLKEKFNQDS